MSTKALLLLSVACVALNDGLLIWLTRNDPDEAEMRSQRWKRSAFRADNINLGTRGEATRKTATMRQFSRAPNIQLVEFMEL